MRKGNVFFLMMRRPSRSTPFPCTSLYRARDLLAQALEMEIETVLNQYKDLKDQEGHQRAVRRYKQKLCLGR